MPVYYNSDSMKKWRMDSTTTRKDFNEKNKPIIISDDSDGICGQGTLRKHKQ